MIILHTARISMSTSDLWELHVMLCDVKSGQSDPFHMGRSLSQGVRYVRSSVPNRSVAIEEAKNTRSTFKTEI